LFQNWALAIDAVMLHFADAVVCNALKDTIPVWCISSMIAIGVNTPCVLER